MAAPDVVGLAVPQIAIVIPAGWEATSIPPPTIAKSAGASVTSWQAYHAPDDATALVAGCVATPIPGWVEEMRPAIEVRTVALVGAATTRITGVPMDVRGSEGASLFVVRAASDLDGPVLGHAQTFLGFDESRVFTCVASCSARRSAGSALGEQCRDVIAAARLEGSSTPPRPGLGLRSATWAVQHPREAVLGGGLLVVMGAWIAIRTRRQPRSKAS